MKERFVNKNRQAPSILMPTRAERASVLANLAECQSDRTECTCYTSCTRCSSCSVSDQTEKRP